MAWPPPVLPVNRTDAVYQQTNHPDDHNKVNAAVNDLVAVVKGLAPGYVASVYVGAEQTGIQTAFTTLTGVRVDFVELIGHRYLFALQCQLRKAGADGAGVADVQMIHSVGGTFGPATTSIPVVPYYDMTVLLALRVGTVNTPQYVIAQAKTDVGYLNVGRSTLFAVDLGPHTP